MKLTIIGAGAIGGYYGAVVGKRIHSTVIRTATLLIASCITVAFFARAYGRARGI